MPNKPAAIRQLESLIQSDIPKLSKTPRNYHYQAYFITNKSSQITEIGLNSCKITKLLPLIPILRDQPNLTSLDLSNNAIGDISLINNLPQLQKLDLRKNRIRRIAALPALTKLTELNLSGNTVVDLAPLQELPLLRELVLSNARYLDITPFQVLTNLTSLDLSGTNIDDVGFLENLTDLRSLLLDSNHIQDLSALHGMSKLTSLGCIDNKIERLTVLSNLTDLVTLNFSGNQVHDLSFATDLTKLRTLWLYANRVKDISSIAQLSELNSIGLGANGIYQLPVLTELTKVKVLQLTGNRLSDISPLKDLVNLEHLDLSENQISNISPLSTLIWLRKLDLSENQLKIIPRFIFDLGLSIAVDSRHGEIVLSKNPLTSPPTEILRQGLTAAIKWLDEDKVSVNEVKILLVGHGEVGKTTLVKSLLGKTPDPKEPSTHHINISSHQVNHNGKSVKLNFWDFGGQEVMHSTHQFFLSTRSIYLLLLDGRRDEDPEYWLKHIESFGGGSPVLVVLNKIDTNPSFDVNRRFLQTKYPFIKGFYKTACFPVRQGIEEIWQGLQNLLDQAEILTSIWPAAWLHIKERLENMTDNFISQSGYDNLCASKGVTDEVAKSILAEYLNDLGIIVHFKDLRLNNLHILQPRWASRAAYKIINSKKIADNHGLFKAEWLAGIMKKQDDQDFDYPAYVFPFILDLMQKFELCYSVNDKNEYLIPELMDIQQPDLPVHEGPILRFFLQFEDLLPRSIITKFIVRMHEDIIADLRWRTGAVLKVDIFKTIAIVNADLKERKIHISVSGPHRKEHFAIIRKNFHTLIERFPRLIVSEWIPLPRAETSAVEYQELIGFETGGREEIFVGKLGKAYQVADLLNGIEAENIRKQEFKWSAFLCHCSLDKPIVQKIADDMEEKGIPYWLDEQQIKAGDSVINKISDGLQLSSNIILCISRNQLKSNWSRKEYNSVLNRYISGYSSQRIVPLVLDDTPLSELPPLLADIKNVSYTDTAAYRSFLSSLSYSIEI